VTPVGEVLGYSAPMTRSPPSFAGRGRLALVLAAALALALAACKKDGAGDQGHGADQAGAATAAGQQPATGDQAPGKNTAATKDAPAPAEATPAESAPAEATPVEAVAAAADPATAGPSALAAAGPASASPRAVLIDKGKAPRRLLRYAFKPGQAEKVSLLMTIGMEMEMASGQSLPIQMPPIEMILDLKVTEKLSEHENRVKFTISKIDVKPSAGVQAGMVQTLRDQLAKAAGASGTVAIDDQGNSRDMTLSLPASMPAQMRQMMESSKQTMSQLSSPLPAEPVGRGARWDVHQVIAQNGLTIDQVAHFQLMSLKGNKMVLRTTLTQSANRQKVALPGMPAGASAELLSHRGTGSGVIHAQTTHLVPDDSQVGVKTESALSISGGGQSQTMRMKVNTQVGLKRLP
jgi:hypothetical protein